MNLKAKVAIILQKRIALHIEDPTAEVYWEQLADLLGQDEEETIQLLNCASANEVLWLSEVFEDIAERLKSQQYIGALEQLQNKFPNLDLQSSINAAKSFI